MKVITCASYYGSGSSAVMDLVSEYEGVKSLSNYEFRFLHDLDGISDLEYYLCECHNRHNSGHALKRFIRLSKFNAGNIFSRRYGSFFAGEYGKLTKEYVSNLTDFSYNGWWFYDLYEKGNVAYYLYQLVDKCLKKISKNKFRILPKEITFCAHPSEKKFINCTQKYVHDLLCAANDTNAPYIAVDQILPSQNINRVMRYFSDEVFAFVIDRDPRDIYTLSKFYWRDCLNPYDDVNEFCQWYSYTRESGSPEILDDKHVLKIHFEDFIYNYNATIKKVEHLLGLSSAEHKFLFKKLNPKLSVHNTQVWKRHNIDEDISIIEQRLTKYLYPFELMGQNDIEGIEQKESHIF